MESYGTRGDFWSEPASGKIATYRWVDPTRGAELSPRAAGWNLGLGVKDLTDRG